MASITLRIPLGRPLTIAEVDDNFNNINEELITKSDLAFKNFLVAGQPTIVATTKDDSITLVAGSGTTLTTDAGSRTLTIASEAVDSLSVVADNTNASRFIAFVDGTGNQQLKVDNATTPLSYNPSTNLMATSISGNAATATTATNANNVAIAADATNAIRYLTFTTVTSGNGPIRIDTNDLQYNPSNNTLFVPQISTGGNLNVGGDLIVNGTTTTVNSTVVTLDDPVITLGGDTPPTVDDNKDRGVEFRWHTGAAARLGFFGFRDSNGRFAIIPEATNTGEVFTGTLGEIEALNFYGALSGNATTATTLQTARTIALSGAATGTATSFNGSANITIPVTGLNASNLNAGTVPDARISGSYTGMTNLTGSGTVDFARFLGNTADTAAAPSFSFTSDSNTGIWSAAADTIGFAAGGTNRMSMSTTTLTGTIIADFTRFFGNTADTALLPSFSFTGDQNTGIWQPGADQLGFSTGGTNKLTITTTAITSTLNITAPTFIGALTGNATTATTLQTARTIAISGAATGTATSFNGSANISIPVTALDASSLTTGIVPDARLTGIYSNFTLKLNGNNTVFGEPNPVADGGSASSTAARSVTHLVSYRNAASNATGAIVFVAPNATSTNMIRFELNGLTHSGGHSYKSIIRGYRTTGAWNSFSKINLGTIDVDVRLGVAPNGNQCVILGDVNTVWSYPYFEIINAMFSHTGATDAYSYGWTSGLFTDLASFTDVTAIIPNSVLDTALDASDLITGVVPDARISGSYTGMTNLTGSGTVDFAKFLGNASDTATAPSFSFTSDTNTGMWRPGADQLGFATAGVSRLNITTAAITSTLNITAPTFIGALSGNATTATTLQTARTIALSGAATGTATSFNGSANISIPVTALDASSLTTGTVPDARISGSYTGMTNLTGSGNVDFARFLGNAADTVTAPSFSFTGDLNTGMWQPGADQLGFATGGVSRLNITTTAITSTLNITAPTFIGALTGNATTATTLQTARTINGTSFNGSANITTANWGTARTLNGVSVNGSTNYTLPTNNTADNDSTATHFVSFSASSATGNNGSKVSTKLTFQPSTGDLTSTGNITGFSDGRLKIDWLDHDCDIINKVASITNGTFTRIDTGQRQTGIKAQDLLQILPEAVIENDDGILSVAYGNAALTLVVELAKEVLKLKEEIAMLIQRGSK